MCCCLYQLPNSGVQRPGSPLSWNPRDERCNCPALATSRPPIAAFVFLHFLQEFFGRIFFIPDFTEMFFSFLHYGPGLFVQFLTGDHFVRQNTTFDPSTLLVFCQKTLVDSLCGTLLSMSSWVLGHSTFHDNSEPQHLHPPKSSATWSRMPPSR